MSNHKQTHAMTGIYAPLTIRTKTETNNSADMINIKTKRKQFQDYLGLKDDSVGEAVNSVDPNQWVISSVPLPTNYLPRGTIFRHLTFIPTTTPDFRKVELSIQTYVEPDSTTLKSVAPIAKRPDTIKKREIKSILTPITGRPKIDATRTIDDVQSQATIATGIVNFLASSLSEGTSTLTIDGLKLEIDKKIKAATMPQNVKNHLYDSMDQAFGEIRDGSINGVKVVANQRTVDDTFNYIVEKLLFK